MDRPILSRLATAATYFLITLFGMGLILFAPEMSKAASDGLFMCLTMLIPSMFPFFVLSSLVISTGMAQKLSKAFAPLMSRLFALPGECSAAVILGLVGGYPTGAKTAFELYDKGLCDARQCQRLLSFCSNCGPAFIFSVIGASMFGSVKAGALLYLCHVLSALALGMLGGLFSKNKTVKSHRESTPGLPLYSALPGAVKSSFASMLDVCAFVIFFSCFTAFLSRCGITSAIASPLPFKENGLSQAFVHGLLEMTGGTAALSSISTLSFPKAMAFCAFFTGWGGISVHCQTAALRGSRPVSLLPYIKGKLLHGVLSAVLCYFAALPMAGTAACLGVYTDGTYIASPAYFMALMSLYLLAAFLLTVLLSMPDRKKK